MDAVERYPSHDCFGVKITPMTSADLIDLYRERVNSGQQCVTSYQNMHGLHVRLHDAALERLHRLPETFVYIDGMPLVLLCRLAGVKATRAHRVTFVDFIWSLLELADREKWRVFYLGATEDVLGAGIAAIAERLPNLQLLGHNGYFDAGDSTANRHVLDEIAAFGPDLVLVGMGMPRQEKWILDNLAELAPASVCAVGALIEYLAGAVPVPPRWMGRIGLEWSFRLLSDPKRFWFRYLVEPWVVAGAMLRHMSLRPPSELPIAIDSAMMGPITATPEPGLAGAVAADTLVTPVSG
jgi:N-acetylglucosaminyldiphosphoundecaprenol N-acetyl-beta-D-mannosaminyltransferase